MDEKRSNILDKGFIPYKQWKQLIKGVLGVFKRVDPKNEADIRRSYFDMLHDHLNNELVMDPEKAFSKFIKLAKRYKGFSDYLEESTPYKRMLALIREGETDKAKKEYRRVYASSPELHFLKAKKLAEKKQHRKALDLALKALAKFEYGTVTQAQIHVLTAGLKQKLKIGDAREDIEAAVDLFLKEMENTEADKRLTFLILNILDLGTREEIWNNYQELIAEKLCPPLNGGDIIVLFSSLNGRNFRVDEFTPVAIKNRMEECDIYIEGNYPDPVKDAALQFKANDLMMLSRYEDAAILYKESMSLAPDHGKWHILANSQYLAGLYEDALFSISEALESDPDNATYLGLKVVVLGALGRQREALEIGKVIPKPVEDRMTFPEFTALMATGQTKQILEMYESIDRSSLSNTDLLILLASLWYENKMAQASDLYEYLLDNLDNLHDKDDPTMIASLIIMGTLFRNKSSDLYDKYVNSILSSGSTFMLSIKVNALDVDFADWLRGKDIFKELVARIKAENVFFDLKQMALNNHDPAVAREFLEDHRDLLDPHQYRRHDLRLSILEGKDVEFGAQLNELISQAKDKDLELLLKTAYENERYDLVYKFLDIRPSGNPRHAWYRFMACTFQGRTGEARQALEDVDFDQLINSRECADVDSLLNFRDVKMSPFQVLESIDSLFATRFPYYKIALENFTILLKKASDPSLHKPIDWSVESVLEMAEKQPEKLKMNSAYGEEYNDLMVKKAIMDRLSGLLIRQEQKNAYASQCLRNRIQESILERYTEIVDTVKREERNRILANLSHSIKNLLKSVIDPLTNLREEMPQKAMIIDNAIKGANLIRGIVNAINLSFKTTLEELEWDVIHPGGESMTLQDMIRDSLRYSVSNMFDFRYFPSYAASYFPQSLKKKEYERIRREWGEASSGGIDMLERFLERHMFKLELDLDDSRDYHVGNEKSSAIKLMILFQEIIFNAVKYASFVPRDERRIGIRLEGRGDKLRLAVENTYSPRVQAKTTGVGKLVIENFAKVLGCSPDISTEDDKYTITLEFKNIWRDNA